MVTLPKLGVERTEAENVPENTPKKVEMFASAGELCPMVPKGGLQVKESTVKLHATTKALAILSAEL